MVHLGNAKHNPTTFERIYCFTLGEIAHMTGQHPVTVAANHREKGDAFWQPKKPHINRGRTKTNHKWKTESRFNRVPWLHENHPDYKKWRDGELFEDSIKR